MKTGRRWRGDRRLARGEGGAGPAATRGSAAGHSAVTLAVGRPDAALRVLLASPLDKTIFFFFLLRTNVVNVPSAAGGESQQDVRGVPRHTPAAPRRAPEPRFSRGSGGGVSIQIPTGHSGSSRDFLAPIDHSRDARMLILWIQL